MPQELRTGRVACAAKPPAEAYEQFDRVVWARRDILPRYDANEDHILQEPELTTLYVHEAARGLGYPVARIDPIGSSGAIVTSRADISALVRFVERHRHEMAQPQQRIFRDLYWLGLEVDTLPHFFTDEVEGPGL